MLPMFRKSFWVPYPESDVYPTVSKAREAISRYCEQNGWSCSFPGEDEALIDGMKSTAATRPGAAGTTASSAGPSKPPSPARQGVKKSRPDDMRVRSGLVCFTDGSRPGGLAAHGLQADPI